MENQNRNSRTQKEFDLQIVYESKNNLVLDKESNMILNYLRINQYT
jgi:hypothetical protein